MSKMNWVGNRVENVMDTYCKEMHNIFKTTLQVKFEGERLKI